MKKNAMLKIAAILLVAVLLTTCAISTTFAKYVTNGTETPAGGARVAKWGLKFEALADDDKQPIFLNEYENGGFTLAYSADEIVAPGTTNAGIVDVKITGMPEVSFQLKADVTVSLDKWTVKESGNDVFYCPLTFTIGGAAVPLEGVTTQADAEEAVANAIANALTGANNADNGSATMKYEISETGFASDFNAIAATVSWEWPKEVDDDYDTQLGNAAAEDNAATIAISYTLSAEQIFS